MYVSSSSYNMHVSFSFTVSELGSKNKLGTKFANSVPSLPHSSSSSISLDSRTKVSCQRCASAPSIFFFLILRQKKSWRTSQLGFWLSGS